MKKYDFIKLKYNLKTNSKPIVLESHIDSVPKIAFITKSNKIAFYSGRRSFQDVKNWIEELNVLVTKETIDPMKLNT